DDGDVAAELAHVLALRRRQQQFFRRYGREDFGEAAQLLRNHDDRSGDGDVDQHILDDGDHRRRAQAAGIGVGGENRKAYDQWNFANDTLGRKTERADDDFDADQIQRDIRHRRDNAGDGNRSGQPARTVAHADEIGRRDAAVAMRDRPQAREDDEGE